MDEDEDQLGPKPSQDSESSGEEKDKDGAESDVEEEVKRSDMLTERLKRLKKKYGTSHDKVISCSLKLVHSLIPLYKLNETEAVLDEILPFCKEKGGKFHIKAIQSKAFCLFKQYKFKEALVLFHEQATLVGPSAALYENMAHTFSSVGDYDSAATYFTQALQLLGQGSYGKKGGIYLGLGLVRERQGRPEEALPILQKALQHYIEDVGSSDGSSLIAKAHMSVGQCFENLKQLPDAVNHIKEAVRIFKKTVGNVSPLTANSLGVLGRLYLAQGKRELAEPCLRESLDLEVDKDAFHPDTVWKLLNSLQQIWTEGQQSTDLAELNRRCSAYVGAVQRCRRRIDSLKLLQDPATDKGTIAVIYKTGGELCMLAGEYPAGRALLQEALKLLETIQSSGTFDCRTLIDSVQGSLRFLAGSR